MYHCLRNIFYLENTLVFPSYATGHTKLDVLHSFPLTRARVRGREGVLSLVAERKRKPLRLCFTHSRVERKEKQVWTGFVLFFATKQNSCVVPWDHCRKPKTILTGFLLFRQTERKEVRPFSSVTIAMDLMCSLCFLKFCFIQLYMSCSCVCIVLFSGVSCKQMSRYHLYNLASHICGFMTVFFGSDT